MITAQIAETTGANWEKAGYAVRGSSHFRSYVHIENTLPHHPPCFAVVLPDR
jgi:hypothetical protein